MMAVQYQKVAPLIHLLMIILCSSLQGVKLFSIQAQPANPHQQQLSSKTNAKQQLGTSNYTTNTIASLLSQQQQQQLGEKVASSATKHLEQSLNDVSLDVSEPRSASFGDSASVVPTSSSSDHDESVPLATINNHSRNNQPPLASRPPQYVDVSNLIVARNANRTSPLSGSSSSASLASGLQAKSRSGLPECATQQVCNAIFVRMNYTQKLCECSSNYNWRCSNNLDPQDGHTIELTRKFDKRIYTQIKTCEPLREVRACKSPTDWTLLALQSERSGKAHYVVVCKCPTWAQLEGPYTHNHPPYANIPGIRVYGMLCAHQTARSSAQTYSAFNPSLNILPEFPWPEALNVLNTTNLLSTLDGQQH